MIAALVVALAACSAHGAALRVRWEGAFFAQQSLAHVNRQLAAALADRVELLVALRDGGDRGGWLPSEDMDRRLLEAVRRSFGTSGADVVVRHVWPPVLAPPPIGHWVVVQPWEAGPVPVAWVESYGASADQIWCPSQHVCNWYAASGVDEDILRVVPNGVDTDLFRPDVPPTDALPGGREVFRFLFVGAALRRKGIDTLAEAFEREFAADADAGRVQLVIKDSPAAGMYSAAHRAMASELEEVPGVVHLDRDLAPRDLAALYTAADCFVLPFRGEGFGLPLLEAMASGVPVITSGYGPALELIQNGTTGFLVPAVEIEHPSDYIEGVGALAGSITEGEVAIDDLRQMMRHVYEHPAEARAVADAAVAHVREAWTWQHAADKALAALRELEHTEVRRHEAIRRAQKPRRRRG